MPVVQLSKQALLLLLLMPGSSHPSQKTVKLCLQPFKLLFFLQKHNKHERNCMLAVQTRKLTLCWKSTAAWLACCIESFKVKLQEKATAKSIQVMFKTIEKTQQAVCQIHTSRTQRQLQQVWV